MLLDNRPKEALDVLNTLQENELTKFQIQIKEELEADIYISEGDLEKARSLYQNVLASTFSSSKRRILQVKIDNLENMTVHDYLNQPTKQNLAKFIFLTVIVISSTISSDYDFSIRINGDVLLSFLTIHSFIPISKNKDELYCYKSFVNWKTGVLIKIYDGLCHKTSKLRISMYCEEEKERTSFMKSVFLQK